MKKLLTKSLALLLAAIMVLGAAPFGGGFVTEASADDSGTCGPNLSYSFSSETGVLSITGTGDMNSYSTFSPPPWTDYRSEITAITVGTGVTSIGYSAFYSCSNLTSVTLPDGLRDIGSDAFKNCSSLVSIAIPEGVRSVENIFSGCSTLESISIPASVEYIYFSEIRNCAALKEIIIDENNSSYYSDENGVVFNKRKNNLYFCPPNNTFTSYEIPASVTYIDYSAFKGNKSLVSVTFAPGGRFDRISDNSFEGCTALESIDLPEGMTAIGAGAFYGCTALMDIDLPSSVMRIGGDAFAGTGYALNVDNWANDALIIDNCFIVYEGDESTYAVPEGARLVAQNAFWNNTNLTSVTIPSSVRNINANAFAYCMNLSSVGLAEGLEEIGERAFSDCGGLTQITLPASVDFIGYSAFASCTELETVSFAQGSKLTYIESSAFYSCAKLSSIEIPAGVTYIGSQAFYDTAIYNTESNWVDGLLIIDNCLIEGISEEETCVIPEGIRLIADSAFYGNEYITSVTIPASVEYIGSNAFSECSELVTITFAENCLLKGLGYGAFYDTGYYNNEENWTDGSLYLDKILLKVQPDTEQSAFEGIYIVREGTRLIDSSAFENCCRIKGAVIPSSVVSAIDWYLDSSNGVIEFIHLPAELTDFDEWALYYVEGCYICCESDDCAAKAEAERNGLEFRVCAGHCPDCGNELTVIAAVPATCTATGLTAGKSCAVCDKVVVAQTVTEKLAHTPGEWIVDTAAGVRCKKCTVCQTVLETEDFIGTTITITPPSKTTINYGDTLVLHANTSSMPAGAKVVWTAEGDGFDLKPSADGMTCEATSQANGEMIITAKVVDEDGNAIMDGEKEISATQKLTSKAGFFQKLISFFKNLFNINRVIAQAIGKIY